MEDVPATVFSQKHDLSRGGRAVAVTFLHAYTFRRHEEQAGALCREVPDDSPYHQQASRLWTLALLQPPRSRARRCWGRL